MQKWGERIFSNLQLGIRAYIRTVIIIIIIIIIINFATSKNLVVKSTMFSPPLLIGRLTTRLIQY